jgi:hypothetical protein
VMRARARCVWSYLGVMPGRSGQTLLAWLFFEAWRA